MVEQTNTENKPLTISEIEDLLKQLATAHDEQQAEIRHLKTLLTVHEHSKNGQTLFPYNE
jgi:hypothetical protein